MEIIDFDPGLGDYNMDQLRQICQEAIALGEADERASMRARRRRLKFMLLVTTIAAAGSTAAVYYWSLISL